MHRSTGALLLVMLLAACTTPRLLPFDGGDADASDGAAPDAWMCVMPTRTCESASECCGDRSCESTVTSGPERTVCCGRATQPCSFSDGEDCCGVLVCRTTTSSGTTRVCCATAGDPCETSPECCGTLLCRGGVCTD